MKKQKAGPLNKLESIKQYLVDFQKNGSDQMDTDETLRSAVGFLETGEIQQAESLCKEVLDMEPKNSAALFTLGVIFLQSGNYDLSISYLEKSLQIDQTNAAAYYNLGISLQEKNHLDKAILYYQRAIELDPDLAPAYCNLGAVFQKINEFDKAIPYYQKALELDPLLVSASYNLGSVLQEKGELEEAIPYYQMTLKLNPAFADAWNTLGSVLQGKGQIDEAIDYYLRAIECDPHLADAYYNLGKALMDKGQLEEAMAYYQKALELRPNFAEAHNNLGFCLLEQGQSDKALLRFEKAISLKADFAEAYYNLALYHHDRNFPDEAIHYYEKTIQLKPDFVDAHWNMACALLLTGDFDKGWKEYEWRWELKGHRGHRFSLPRWDGSEISGKTILLHAEQAFGDTIQFVRYAPLIAQRGAKVILQSPKVLVRLLRSVKCIEQVVADGAQLPKIDLHCPLLSLPLALGTALNSIPAQIPYIHVDPLLFQKWRDRLQPDGSRTKIGLVWRGRIKEKRERRRACSLGQLLNLTQFENATFYSLQKRDVAEQAEIHPQNMKLVDYTEELDDFLDTAALVANLDLIISVDTAVAHMAGALGKPVWTMLPFAADWRWMLDRTDTPWYPSMRLFRQPSPGNWQAVISDVARELDELLNRTL
jgi:tetratricopeptide (TPR) repeat protein